ncbi:MAG: hypothetical protein O2884_08580 [Chloroflexi bacterium]|nr:hypothetical protein [Chloroflexota bacterium]
MPVYDIVPAASDLAVDLASRLRKADREEVWASHRLAPVDAVMDAVLRSRDPSMGTVDGVPVIVFGDAPDTPIGTSTSPWMLATDELERHARTFLLLSRVFLHELTDDCGFRYLHNYVDARNLISIRWLRWLGFTVYPAAPFGVDGQPFHYFDMTRA